MKKWRKSMKIKEKIKILQKNNKKIRYKWEFLVIR